MGASDVAVKPEFNFFLIFMVTWTVLGVFSFVFFRLGKNGRLKRILWPIEIILASILFIGFMYLLGLRNQMLIMVIPMVLLIAIGNLTMVRFCLSCGNMAMYQNPFQPLKRCPKCNTAFNQNKRSQSDDLRVLQGDRDC